MKVAWTADCIDHVEEGLGRAKAPTPDRNTLSWRTMLPNGLGNERTVSDLLQLQGRHYWCVFL
jgi:hypothetical protein